MKKTITLLALLFAFVCQQTYAQDRTISGTVTSSQDNQGIPGVAVVAIGTTIGAITDIDGKYTVVVPATTKQLRYSGVGLKTKIVDIGSSDIMDLKMDPDVLKLEEVVVTAIGISREKKALGYSTQTVQGEDVNTTGTGNVLNELSGKVSGLNVVNSTGTPGGGTYVQLRGVTSLTGNNQPLMVVDGVPIDNSINNYDPTSGFTIGQTSGANSNTVGGTNPENRGIDINPNDIASVTVLKGPAATALYGIQAASGAIIITTKKGGGVPGHVGPIVTINSSSTWSSVNKLPERQETYAQGSKGNYIPPFGTGPKNLSWGPAISTLHFDGVPTQWDKHGTLSTTGTGDPAIVYDPYDFFQVGFTADNNVALSGGTDKSGFRMSIGNIKQTGVVPLTGYVKTNVSLSGQTAFSKRFSASANANYVKSETDKVQQGSNISGLMLGLLRTPSTFDNSNGVSDPVHDSTSYIIAPAGTERDYRGGPGYDNPYWTINRNPYHQDLDRFFGSAQVDYRLANWINLTGRLGGDFYSQATKNGYDIHSNAFSTGAIFLVDYANKQYNSDVLITLEKRFNSDFAGHLILGHNYYTQYYTNRLMTGNGFAVPTWYDLGNALSFISGESETRRRGMAEYAEAELDYRSQLFLTVTGRNETSSTLPSNNNVFFYPSASVGWVFTEMPSLANNKNFPYGKLRVSYAGVGKDAPPYALTTPYIPTHVQDGWSPGIFYPLSGLPGFALSNSVSVIGNPDLKPEHTNSFEIGLDLAFIQNRIGLTTTYYNYKTTDGIFTVPISYTTGFASVLQNAADISNKGIEVTLNLTPVKLKNSFQWDITLNWSKNKNVVTDLAPGIDNLFLAGFTNGGLYAVKGQPFGVIYGSRYVRVDPNNASAESKDVSGTLLINDAPGDPGMGMPIPGNKNGIIGNIQPDWLGSAITTFTFMGFTLSGQIDIRKGGDIWNGTRGAMAYFGTGKETEDRTATKTFSGVYGHLDVAGNIVHYDGTTNSDGSPHEAPGPGSANTTQVTLGQYYWQNIGNSFIGPTEPDVEDGSYVKLRQVSLGYEFPMRWFKGLHLSRLNLTVFANNIILHTKYSGVDPETSLVGPANGQGLDYFNNPGVKSIGFRVTIGI